MSREKRTKKLVDGWGQAARDARRQIEQAKARIASLEKSVRICEQKAKDGEPWPGAQLDSQDSEQQHSV